jgi:hypothetical protein
LPDVLNLQEGTDSFLGSLYSMNLLWVWCSFLFPNAFMWAWLPASSSKSIAFSGRDQSGIYRADKYPAVSTASVVMSHL